MKKKTPCGWWEMTAAVRARPIMAPMMFCVDSRLRLPVMNRKAGNADAAMRTMIVSTTSTSTSVKPRRTTRFKLNDEKSCMAYQCGKRQRSKLWAVGLLIKGIDVVIPCFRIVIGTE